MNPSIFGGLRMGALLVLALLLSHCESIPAVQTGSDDDPATEKWQVQLPELPEEAKPLTMVHIPEGTFEMGTPPSEPGHEENESPVHPVTLTRPFYMSQYEITQAQWMTIMDENPSTQWNINYPVNRVSWQDVQTFLKRLNGMLNDGRYRLPTEAEWEYACRAGTATITYFGDDRSIETLEEHAWLRTNSEGKLHEVGLKPPNPWGLYDLYGNVWEWCHDWYGPYSAEPSVDPMGPATGEEKVIRGASWMARPEYIRSGDRGKMNPERGFNTGGFRLVWMDQDGMER